LLLGSACQHTTEEQDDLVPAKGHFEAVWSDEFNTDNIDPEKWYVLDRHEDYWPETPWRRNYKASNVRQEDGALIIQTIKEADGSFSSGWISTFDYGKPALFEQTYGSFEARLKFPKQQGHWCAFWIMNPRQGEIGNGGVDGTEIDILEKAVLKDRIEHNLHWDGYAEHHKSVGQTVEGFGLDDGEWHTVRLEWYPNLYIFYVDDQETWRTQGGGICKTPGHIIISEEIGNFGIGPEAWGTGPIEEAELPDEYLIDYVRVSKWVPEN